MAPPRPRSRTFRRLLIGVLAVMAILVTVGRYIGPLSSGAFLLLLPVGAQTIEHGVPHSYQALHKGAIHLGTGLYVREDEDLVVHGTPTLILRRTYLSGYRVSREFGIGTTHNGEVYLAGDPVRFAWLVLVLPDGVLVRFERTSPGRMHFNAMFEHRTSPSEWFGARLGWTGTDWALQRADGTLMRFQPCGGRSFRLCSIVQERDADGHIVHYRRDAAGQLSRIEAAADRWIAFEYDANSRVRRAHDSAGNEVRYSYDERGRLSHVRSSDGREHRYGYTAQDELSEIVDPEIRIENQYDVNGRCIRQVNYLPGDPQPFTFDFDYVVKDGAVVQVDTTRSDGTWTRTVYANRYIESESWARTGVPPATITYERDPVSNVITALSLTCPDREGRSPLRHRGVVRDGDEAWVKWDLFRTHCSWLGFQWQEAEQSSPSGAEGPTAESAY